MGDFSAAFNFVMSHEDSTLNGNTTPDPSKSNPNAVARFGLNSASNPQAVAAGFYTMDRDAALEYAANEFKYNYFSPMGCYQIKDQDLCDKIVDIAFNTGKVQATKIVQRALNVCGASLAVDGLMGQKTIDAINAADPVQLLYAIKEKSKDFYVSLAAANPEDQKFLAGWLARANT